MTLRHLWSKLALSFWLIVSLSWFVWSYVLTDGNLVLSRFSYYWNAQEWLWQNILPQKQWLSVSYFMIIIGLFLAWLGMILVLKGFSLKAEKKLNTKKLLINYILLVLPFILAYNALSHDIFNYIFNAKMIMVYHANPHVQVALDFVFDPWTRFMHNVHTPAPYGYGWTGISLLPYILGLGKFSLTWLVFKLFNFIGVVWLFFNLRFLANLLNLRVRLWQWASLFLNPLFTIEVFSNGHNDIWMMNLLVLATVFVIALIKHKSIKIWHLKLSKLFSLLLSLILFAFAGWIKLASLVTIFWYGPLLLASLLTWQGQSGNFLAQLINLWLKPKINLLIKLTPLVYSVLLFLLLLTTRSRQFLPWYLTWSLIFLPLLLASIERITLGIRRIDSDKQTSWLPHLNLTWALWLISFSFTALLRYLPWIYFDTYSPKIILEQKYLTWVIGIFIFGGLYLMKKKGKLVYKLLD